MKAKLKFDKAALQAFALRHVEKAALLVVVGLFLAMGYYAIARPVYTRSPQDLASLATQTREQVEKTPAEVGQKPVADYPQKAMQGQKAIEVEGYAWKTYWDPRVFPKAKKRGEPSLLAVQKLRAAANCGAFTLGAGAEHGAGQGGRRWVVVTGVVPLSEQIEAFNQALRFMRRPESDTPKYLGYEIERADVAADAPDGTPAWKPLDVRAAYAEMKSWSGPSTEVVSSQYFHERLTFPLGPLMAPGWDEQAAHPPEIPVHVAGDGKSGAGVKPDAGRPKPVGGSPGPGPGVLPGINEPTGEPTGEPTATEAAPVKRLHLFRFFDYTVEAGRQYRYRVRVALANPNTGVEPRFLVNPESAKPPYLWTEWSEPTGVAAVVRDDRLLLVSVKPPMRNYGDPEAAVLIVKWLVDRGVYVHEKFPSDRNTMKLYRGQWLNLSGILAEERPVEGSGLDDEKDKRKKKPAPATGAAVNYQPDALLLDMRGGEKFPGRDKGVAPAEVLVWDHDQKLLVRDEVDDLAAVEAAVNTGATTASAGDGGGDAPIAGKGAAKAESSSPGIFDLGGESSKKGAAKKPEAKAKKPK